LNIIYYDFLKMNSGEWNSSVNDKLKYLLSYHIFLIINSETFNICFMNWSFYYIRSLWAFRKVFKFSLRKIANLFIQVHLLIGLEYGFGWCNLLCWMQFKKLSKQKSLTSVWKTYAFGGKKNENKNKKLQLTSKSYEN